MPETRRQERENPMTDTPAHTPGPWVYRPHDHDDWGIVRVTADESRYGFVICQARNPDVIGDSLDAYRKSGGDPYEANARLIAAAPALLDALRGLLDEIAKSPCADSILDSAAAGHAFAALSQAGGE